MLKKLNLLVVILFVAGSLLAHKDKRPTLEFVENYSQWHENVLFRTTLPGGIIYLEENAFTYKFFAGEDLDGLHDLQFESQEIQNQYVLDGHSWKIKFENALTPMVNGDKKQTHYYNYFKGSDQSKWASKVPVFNAIDYENLYHGINLRAYNSKDNFKYDFMVDANADASQILLSIQGIDGAYLKDGSLILPTSIGDFQEAKPFAFQLIDGKLIEVECNYVLNGNQLSFEFPNGYDHDYKLTIDPELIASTLSGTTGFASNFGHTATFDEEGNIYTGCISFDSEYPTNEGSFQESYGGGGTDFGISKLNPTGSDLIWASFVGGDGGEYPHSMIANGLQELYVYGSTTSSDFPITDGSYQESLNGSNDIVVVHFEADGSALVGSTYIGGSGVDGNNNFYVNYGDGFKGEIVLDYEQRPVVTSFSDSNDFPTSANAVQPNNAGAQDAVVFRLNEELTVLEMSTYLGSSQADVGFGVKVSTQGNVYVCGMAGADDFYVSESAYQTDFLGGNFGGFGDGEGDAFVVSLNSDGSEYNASTFIGTEVGDQAHFIDLDTEERVYIFGQGGDDWPVVGDPYINEGSRQYITRFSADLSEVDLSTTIGTSNGTSTDMTPVAFLVDNCNNIYISGYSTAANLETTDDALYSTGGFYLAAYSSDLETLEYATYYTENHVDGGTSRFDKNGAVYQAVCSGGGFATTPDAWQTTQSPGWDVGVFKIDFDISGVNAASSVPSPYGCAPYEVDFSNYSVGENYEWDFGDGTTSEEFEPIYTYEEPGVYTVTLIVTDSLSCNIADTLSFDITISTPIDFTPSFDAIEVCENMGVICENNTGIDFLNYVWDMGDGTIIETEDIDEYIYDAPGDYTITLQAIDEGCNDDESVSVDVVIFPAVIADIENDVIEDCGQVDVTFTNATSGADSYYWDFGDGTTSDEENPNHTFIGPGEFEVTLIVHEGTDCETTDTADIIVLPEIPIDMIYQVFAPQVCDSVAEVFVDFQGSGADEITWTMGDGTTLEGPDHTYLYDQPGTYNITITAYHEVCDLEISETVEINYDLSLLNEEMIIPNVFSPNRDGENDFFRIFYRSEDETDLFPPGKNFFDYLNDYSMQIFNRWGNEIFNSENDGNMWDGTLDGNDLPEGAYYYIISYRRKCLDSEVQNQTGTVEIMR